MTEREARAGEGLSQALTPAAEVKSAMTGFLKEFNGFQSEVKQALQHQEERLTMLDRKTMTYSRPALSTAMELDAPHKKAFNAYLRTGDDDGRQDGQPSVAGESGAGSHRLHCRRANAGRLLKPQHWR